MLRRVDPSTVQRLLISNMKRQPVLASRSRASRVGIRGPEYSTINAPFAIGAVANRPSPVFERPMR
jgi:hypothetical protein